MDYGNRSDYWVPSTYGKFVNQDRSFSFPSQNLERRLVEIVDSPDRDRR